MGWLWQGAAIGVTRWRCEVKQRGMTEERTQPWHAFGFTHAGSYELCDARGTALVDSTRVAFFNADAPYQTSHPVEFHDRGGFFVLRPDVAGELIRTHDTAERERPEVAFRFSQAPVSGTAYIRHLHLLQEAEETGRFDPFKWEEEALGLADRVAAEIYGRASATLAGGGREGNRRREAVAAARQFLARRFPVVKRLNDVAEATSISPYHLCRIFKAETGSTIHAYLNGLRLRAALIRLQDRSRDLASLAMDLGFSSHSHFTEAFRREFGVTPSAVVRNPTARLDPGLPNAKT
jgi:AraC-like DNA-binding protein